MAKPKADPPPCGWYVSVDQTECGEPSVFTATHIMRRGKVEPLKKPVHLCRKHKARQDVRFASARQIAKAGEK